MADVTIRRAKLEDKDDVMRIRDDVYAGRDYLLSFYETFVKVDNCFPFVAVIDKAIVGFCAAFLVDDMKTLITRGARVSPTHGGKGIYKLLTATVKEKARELGAIHYSFTSNIGNLAINTDSFRKQNRHILTKEGLVYSINGDEWKPKTCPTPETQIPEVRRSDLELYISSETYINYLFPANTFIVNWVPYRLMKSNLDIVREENNLLILSDVSVGDGQARGMLSIATIFQCSSDTFGCNLDIYGSNLTTFKQHLIQQAEYIASKTRGPTSFIIFVGANMDVDTMKQCADDVGLTKSTWVDKNDSSIRFNELHLFETNL